MKIYITFIVALWTVLIFGQNSPGQYTVKNAKINTQSSDFGTAFFGKDKVVFASPKQGFTLNREENTNQPFLDLYIGELTEDGQIIKKQKLKGDINSRYHEGMVSFTKDMKTVYFSANNFVKKRKNKEKNKSTKYLQLFKASVAEDGEWTNLILLPFNGSNFSSGHPVLNLDDSQLYFVSDRPESFGETDIFVVDISEDGSYSEPRNLGPEINTIDREMFPFIGSDNVLYFSSDGYPGHGELDVYASKIFDSTVSEPINLEEPVNSEHDDFAYIINDDKHRGYFSSNRAGGHGDDDIYSFIASPPIYIECEQEITGVVRDVETQNLVPDVLIVLYDEKGLELESFISSKEEGSFNFQQPCNANYMIKGYLEGYLVGELDITTVNDLEADPMEIILELVSDPNKEDKILVVLDTEAEEFQDNSTTEQGTTAFSSKAAGESFDEEQINQLKAHTAETKISQTENAVAAGAVPVMNSITETQNDDAKIEGIPSSDQMAVTSFSETDPKITSQNSIAMEPSSSVENSTKNELQNDSSKNSIAANTSKNRTPSISGAVPVMVSAVEDEDTENVVSTIPTSAEATSTSISKEDSKIESQNSLAMESSSSVENSTKNELQNSSSKNSIAANTSNKQVPSSSEVVPVMVSAVQDEDTENAVATIPASAEETRTSISKEDSKIESQNSIAMESNSSVEKGNVNENQEFIEENRLVSTDVNKETTTTTNTVTSNTSSETGIGEAKAVVAANPEGKQKSSATDTNQDIRGVKAQKSIAMDMSQDIGKSEDGAVDFQSEEPTDEMIHINTIYFDYNKYNIRFDAKIELEKIAEVLKENPDTKIKVNAHTDIRGKKPYNLKLSKSRAYYTVQYLLNKGIEVERISSEGYGETQVAEKCTKGVPCNGLQHQLNRRSEFLIVNKFSDAIIAQSINKIASGNYAVNEKAANSGLYLNYDFSDNREVYTVQIGAFKGKVQTNEYSKLTDLFNYRYNDGLNRFYAGIFETSSEARSYMNKMKKQGFKDAFVVGLKGESRFF